MMGRRTETMTDELREAHRSGPPSSVGSHSHFLSLLHKNNVYDSLRMVGTGINQFLASH
jgi:hypothetical protein